MGADSASRHGRIEMELAARERKALGRSQAESARAAAEALDKDLDAVERLADVLTRAALVVAGFHQHDRGEWRRKREGE